MFGSFMNLLRNCALGQVDWRALSSLRTTATLPQLSKQNTATPSDNYRYPFASTLLSRTYCVGTATKERIFRSLERRSCIGQSIRWKASKIAGVGRQELGGVRH